VSVRREHKSHANPGGERLADDAEERLGRLPKVASGFLLREERRWRKLHDDNSELE